MKASNYAHARGVWLRPDNHKDYSCHWWLRSICNDHKCGVHMMNLGDIFAAGYSYNYFPREAVVPVLHLDLLSNCWTMERRKRKGNCHNPPLRIRSNKQYSQKAALRKIYLRHCQILPQVY